MSQASRKELQKAEKLIAAGKLDKALKEYKKIVSRYPEDYSAQNSLGDLYVRMNESKNAVPHYQRAAEILEEEGFRTKAIAVLRKGYRQAPSNSQIVLSLSQLLKQEGLIADARQILLELAKNRHQVGQHAEARALYRKVLEIDPNHIEALLKVGEIAAQEGNLDEEVDAYCAIATHLSASARYEEALELIEDVYEAAPEHKTLAKVYTDLLRSTGQQEKAAHILEKLHSSDPGDAETAISLAEIYIATDDTERAMELFNQVRQQNGENERIMLLGSGIAMSSGNFDAALGYLQPLVEKAQEDKQGGLVIRALEEIVNREPNHVPTLKRLLTVYSYLKDRHGRINTLIALSKAHEHAGDLRPAIDAMEEVQQLEPNMLSHKKRLESLYSASGGSAIFDDDSDLPSDLPESLEIQMDDEPEDRQETEKEIRTALMEADVFLRYGLLNKAKERLQQSTGLRNEPLILEKLAEILDDSDEHGKAEAAWKRAEEAWNRAGNEAAAEAARRQQEKYHEDQQSIDVDTTAFDPSFLEQHEESVTAAAPTGEGEDDDPLESKLKEAEYYIEQNFISAAHHLLVTLKEQHPEDKRLNALWSKIEEITSEESEANEVDRELENFFSPLEESPEAMLADRPPEQQQQTGADTADTQPAEKEGGDDSPLKDIAGILEEDLFAVHEAAEKRMSRFSGQDRVMRAERILSHIGSENKPPEQEADAGKHYEMGLAYTENGLLEEAINEFQLSAEDPMYFQKSCLQLGIAFLSKGMHSTAIDWLQRGISGGGDEHIMADSLHQLAIIYQIQGQEDAFRHAVQQLESLDEHHPGLATLKTIL